MQFKDRSDDLLMFLELLQNRKYCRDTLFEETVQVLGLRSHTVDHPQYFAIGYDHFQVS